MPRSKIELLQPMRLTWDYVRQTLFSPFSWKKWVIWGFLAFLGANIEKGSPFFNFNSFQSGRGEEGGPSLNEITRFISEHWLIICIIGGSILFTIMVIGVVWAYLRSRGAFMFLECVVDNHTEIAASWRNNKTQAFSLFLWNLGFEAFFFLFLVTVLVLTFVSVYQDGSFRPFMEIWPKLLLLLGGVILVIIPAMLVKVYLSDFVVPLMWSRKIKVLQAWDVFLDIFRPNAGAFLLYILCRIGLGICSAVLFCGVCCLCCCLSLPVIGNIALLPVFVFLRVYPVLVLSQVEPVFSEKINRSLKGVPQPPEGGLPK